MKSPFYASICRELFISNDSTKEIGGEPLQKYMQQCETIYYVRIFR